MTFGRLARFSTVGVAATFTHVSVAWGLVRGLEMPMLLSNTIAFLVANLASFVANSYLTFRVSVYWRLYPRFFSISLVPLGVSSLLVWGAGLLRVHYLVAISVSAIASALVGFSLGSKLVFARKIHGLSKSTEVGRKIGGDSSANADSSTVRKKYMFGRTGSMAFVTIVILMGAAIGYRSYGIGLREIVDEKFHASQIWTLYSGRYIIIDTVTMIPAYHAIVAMVERLIGFHDIKLIRLVNLLGSLLLPVFIWRLVSTHSPNESARRTVQWFFMPLLFPFFFLGYTDSWALVSVLATVLFAVRGKDLAAGFVGLLAVLLRQDMIVWVLFAWLLAFLGHVGVPDRRRDLADTALLWRALRRTWPLLIVFFLFILFLGANGGVAVGDRDRHAIGFNFTNIAFFLLCAWLVFLPHNLAAWPRVWQLVQRPTCVVILLCGFVFYMWTYSNEHVYNSERFRFFVRNEVLYWMTLREWIRALAFIPMAWMVATACVTRFSDPRMYLLYVIGPLAVGLHPLIEQRYYLPALTLFQIWRPSSGDRWENFTLLGYLVLVPIVTWGITYRRFFL